MFFQLRHLLSRTAVSNLSRSVDCCRRQEGRGDGFARAHRFHKCSFARTRPPLPRPNSEWATAWQWATDRGAGDPCSRTVSSTNIQLIRTLLAIRRPFKPSLVYWSQDGWISHHKIIILNCWLPAKGYLLFYVVYLFFCLFKLPRVTVFEFK